MKKVLLIVALLSAVASAQTTWRTVCTGTGSTCVFTDGSTWDYMRGFINKLPYDSNRQGFIHLGGNDTQNIYTEGFWLYKPTNGSTPASMVRIAWNGTNAADYPHICIKDGGFYGTANPANGHPQGQISFDPTNNKVYWFSGLCGNNFNPVVNVLNSSGTMDARIAAYEFPSCTPSSPVGQCGNGRSYQSSDYWPLASKHLTCCSDGNSNMMLTLFDKGTNTFTDITSSVVGSDGLPCNSGVTCPYAVWTAFASAYNTSDGNMYYAGGCAGTSPGNIGLNVCNGFGNQNDLWQLTFAGGKYKWTKMTAAGGVKPSATNASWALFVYDSQHNKFRWYDANNSLWTGTLSGTTVTWVQSTTTNGPVINVNAENGNIAGYDPVTDQMVIFYNNGSGQSASPAISELFLGGVVGNQVQLTVQEALSPAVNGPNNISQTAKASTPVTRSNEPLTQGVPLPDSWNVSGSTPQLGFTGSGAPTSGQFTCAKRWPSGNCEWAFVSTLVPSIAAGSTTSVTLTTGGSGNFGGTNLATDGTTITVNTGTAVFTIKKANFNVVDTVTVNGVALVSSGTSDLVVTGPAVGTTACAYPPTACTTEYKASADSSSTSTIVENGPVRAVIMSTGRLMNGSQTYVRYWLWQTFYKNQNSIRYSLALRNADESTATASFANAFKMFKSAEIRIGLTLGTGKSATFSTDAANQSYAFTGTESAFKFQGYSQRFATLDGPTLQNLYFDGVNYSLEGERVVGNGSTIYSNGKTAYDDAFWGDVNDSNGRGAQISVFAGDSYWPKSLEYRNGGTDMRIGVFPDQALVLTSTANPYALPYPQHQYSEGLINFHSSALSSANNEALKYQAPLLARPPLAHINNSGVFPTILMTDPAEQDNYLATVGAAGVPTISSGSYTQQTDYASENYWGYGWGGTGGAINSDERWDAMTLFIRRGWTGHYLWAKAGFKYMMEGAFPRADGFRWSTHQVSHPGDINTSGYPYAVVSQSANLSSVPKDGGRDRWCDQYHCHPEGAMDWYYFTADYAVQQWILDAVSDHYSAQLCKNLQPGASYFAGTCSNFVYINVPRGLGAVESNAARLHNYYAAPGPTNNASYASEFDTVMNGMYLTASPDVAVSGTGSAAYGSSKTRGVFNPQTVGNLYIIQPTPAMTPNSCTLYFNYYTPGTQPCTSCYYNLDLTSDIPIMQPYQMSVFLQGWDEIIAEKGTGWANRQNALDIELGWVQWAMKERTYNDGSGRWLTTFIDPETGLQDPYSSFNGIRYTTALNLTASQNGTKVYPGTACEIQPFYGLGSQTVWWVWTKYVQLTGDTSYQTTMNFELQKLMGHGGNSWYDMPGYMLGNAIHAFQNPPSQTLQTVPLTSFTSNGAGSYTLGWSNPTGAQSLALKYSTKTMVDWLNFTDLSGCDTGTTGPGPCTGVNTGIGGQWGLSPTTNQPWFSGTYTPTQPSTGATTITVTGLPTGLTSGNFMLKANAPGTPIVTYTMTVATSGTGSGNTTGAGTYNSGDTAVVTETPLAGSVFSGWSGDCTGSGSCSVLMNANKSVTATFSLSGGGGSTAKGHGKRVGHAKAK